jgi:hypothetical protein
MSAATGRTTRILATVTIALAALTTVTACKDGEGLRDEGPSTSSRMTTERPTTGRPGTERPANEPTATATPRQPSR